MSDPLILDPSPDGTAEAIVEDDGTTVYLYLRSLEDEDAPLKAVWVANRIAAPASADPRRMRDGEAPAMPRDHCRHPDGHRAFEPARLAMVWLPEGGGVALYDGDELLAAILPWSGASGCPGYARDAIGQAPFAWDLTGTAVPARFAAARAYWRSWRTEPSPWARIQTAQLAELERAHGPCKRYFAIDRNCWPPKGLAVFEPDDAIVLATIGVAVRPQPAVEQYTDRPEALRRIELAVALPRGSDDAIVKRMASYLAAQSSLPWACTTWFGHGHTVTCDVLAGRGYSAVVLAASRRVVLPAFDGDPVTLLWMIPISEAERRIAVDRGSDAILATLEPGRPR